MDGLRLRQNKVTSDCSLLHIHSLTTSSDRGVAPVDAKAAASRETHPASYEQGLFLERFLCAVKPLAVAHWCA
jgi:hypothetical protein